MCGCTVAAVRLKMAPKGIVSRPFPASPPLLALVGGKPEPSEHHANTHTKRLAAPRQMGTSWSTLCRGVRDEAGEVEGRRRG